MSKKYLIDTHILIWYLDGNPILPLNVKDELDDAINKVYVSIVSLWEFAIKLSKQKWDIDITIRQVEDYVTARDYEILNISFNHLDILLTLPAHHGDPFDRMLISQAISENLTLMSIDRHFKSYPVNLLW